MIILGIGSNLSSNFGDRFKNINLAVLYLENYGIKVVKRSSFYETPSYPNKNNPTFINIIIEVKTSLPPADLVSVLLFIENRLERKRDKKNEPRTCDIDVIDYNSQVLDFKYKDSDFHIPHKKLVLRNFVLIPLMEIISDWQHPETKEHIGVLIDELTEDEKNSILKIRKN